MNLLPPRSSPPHPIALLVHLSEPILASIPQPWVWLRKPVWSARQSASTPCGSLLGNRGQPAQHYCFLHPTPRPGSSCSPCPSPSCFLGQVHPGHSLPGVRVPHSCGFTRPWGGLWIPAWGVGAGQGGRPGGQISAEVDPTPFALCSGQSHGQAGQQGSKSSLQSEPEEAPLPLVG